VSVSPAASPEAEAASAPADPRSEYERRRDAHAATLAGAEKRHRLASRLRLATAIAAIALAWASLDRELFAPLWLVVPVAVFVGLVFWHQRVKETLERSRRGEALYVGGLARLDGVWHGRGPAGDDLVPPEHLYAEDLDVFGDGSLFQLLSQARTHHGERTLASWLAATAKADDVRSRQSAVAALRSRLDLREDLALAGETLRRAIDADRLAAWGAKPATLGSTWVSAVAVLVSACTIAAFALYGAGRVPAALPLAASVLQAGFLATQQRRVARALRGVDHAASDLALLALLLERFEKECFVEPRLSSLHGALQASGAPASARIHGLRRRVELLDAGRNLLFLPIAIVLLWQVHGAWWIDRWRARFGPEIARWLETMGELEALSSLASHAFEHPGDIFPELAGGAPSFVAEELGHPLLPVATCVRNDVRLDGETQALVVSGSNMSGKSTLLRAVGANAILALAGGTVRARRLCLTPLSLGASIRTHDSLQDGRSRFQAEIERLGAVMHAAEKSAPLLFLLDEILAGTNSHDRRIGAEAVLRGLLDRGAIGLVTTHDLALAEIAESDPRMGNVHFEDHVEGGRMHFDYRMRSGVVRRSNAIALMRAIGLPV